MYAPTSAGIIDKTQKWGRSDISTFLNNYPASLFDCLDIKGFFNLMQGYVLSNKKGGWPPFIPNVPVPGNA